MQAPLDFDSWYRREYKTVLAAATIVAAGDRALAEDATSDAFVKALAKWTEVSAMDSPVGWTITVAGNRVRKTQRRRFRRRLREQKHEAGRPVDATDAYASNGGQVWTALERLSHKQREAIVLRYIEGATQAETARQMGIAPGTAAATLHQARARLHQELTQDGSTQ